MPRKPCTVVDAKRQVMRCLTCGDEVPIPLGSLPWVFGVMKAFENAHEVAGPHERGRTGFSTPIATDAAALIDAALRLEAWLRAKAGDTADWPVHLHVDNAVDAAVLADLLTGLAAAAKGYRENAPLERSARSDDTLRGVVRHGA